MQFQTRAHIDELRARGYEECNLYEPSPDRLKRAEELIDEITEAFKDVRLGVGVGLFEGQAIGDYESDGARALMRSKDEKEAWWNIPSKHLNACHSSLSYMDALGARFHLPAFICCDLRGELDFELEFKLSRVDGAGKNKFSLLSPEQRKLVAAYLEFLADDVDAEFSRKEILEALNDYWRA